MIFFVKRGNKELSDFRFLFLFYKCERGLLEDAHVSYA